jgi:hypothetical protein
MIARLTWQTMPKGAGVAQLEATGISCRTTCEYAESDVSVAKMAGNA